MFEKMALSSWAWLLAMDHPPFGSASEPLRQRRKRWGATSQSRRRSQLLTGECDRSNQQLWHCVRRDSQLQCERLGLDEALPFDGHGDELSRFSEVPSTALRLALLPPPVGRNYLSSRSYLPAPSHWCRAMGADPGGRVGYEESGSRMRRVHQRRHGEMQLRLCASKRADTHEMDGMLQSSSVKVSWEGRGGAGMSSGANQHQSNPPRPS